MWNIVVSVAIFPVLLVCAVRAQEAADEDAGEQQSTEQEYREAGQTAPDTVTGGEARPANNAAGIGKAEGVAAPKHTPKRNSDDVCKGPPLPAGTFKVKNPNGWWPKVSPDGEWVAYGNHAVSVINVRTRQEKFLKEGCLYPDGWIGRGVLRVTSRCDGSAYRFSVPDFEAVATGDNPGLVKGNFGDADDGHWASNLGGRIVYDGKVLVPGGAGGAGGGATDLSADWLVFPKTNDNLEISVWKNGSHMCDYKARGGYNELSVTGGYIVYGRGIPTMGITPGGKEVPLSVTSSRFNEALAKVFFVGTKQRRPWVASVLWEGRGDIGFTFLRPWGRQEGIVLDGCAACLSVVERCGRVVVARSDDKGKLTISVLPMNTAKTTMAEVVEGMDAAKAAKKLIKSMNAPKTK